MGWFALLAGALGFGLVYLSGAEFPAKYAQYLSLAALAGLDSLIGGVRAGPKASSRATCSCRGFWRTHFWRRFWRI